MFEFFNALKTLKIINTEGIIDCRTCIYHGDYLVCFTCIVGSEWAPKNIDEWEINK